MHLDSSADIDSDYRPWSAVGYELQVHHCTDTCALDIVAKFSQAHCHTALTHWHDPARYTDTLA